MSRGQMLARVKKSKSRKERSTFKQKGSADAFLSFMAEIGRLEKAASKPTF